MAGNGRNMGRSTSTTPNTQGEFILLNSKDAYFLVILSFPFLKTPLYYQAIMPHVVPMMLSKLGGRSLVWDDKERTLPVFFFFFFFFLILNPV